jgi:hypothetical protein
MQLSDCGSRCLLMRLDRIWFAVIGGRYGWGLSVAEALGNCALHRRIPICRTGKV